MSITRAENFTDYDIPTEYTLASTVRPILTSAGRFIQVANAADSTNPPISYMALKVPDGVASDPENRRWLSLRTLANTAGQGYHAFSLSTPIIPATIGATNYLSFRMIPMLWPQAVGTTTNIGFGYEFIFGFATNSPPNANGAPNQYMLRQQGHTLVIPTNAGTVTVPEDLVQLAAANRVPLQFDYKLTRASSTTVSISVWCNDVPVVTDGMLTSGTTISYAWIGQYKTTTGGFGTTHCDVYLKDVILVEVDGVGQNYRMGPTARVQGVVPTSDLITEWAPTDGYTGAHYPLMSRLYTNPLPTSGLLADTLGLRESYGMSDLNAALGPNVSAVLLEMLQSNAGSVVRQLEILQGDTVVDTQAANPGAATMLTKNWQVNPVTGLPWTAADVNALTMGYRLKSS